MSTRHFAHLVFGLIFYAVIAISLLSAIPAQGQTYTVIADIPSTPGLENPAAQKIVQGRNGDLYSASGGAVYSLTLSGTDTLVASIFRENNGAGVTLGTDGNFYSTSALGGTGTCGFYGCGYVWKVTPAGVLTTLYNFTGTPDGCNPDTAPVQAPSGIFYGTTPLNCNGGSNDGIIYSITASGTYKVLHTFSGADGATPVAPLTVGPDGNLYGGTQGGGTNSFGVLFRITPAGTYTVLHNFAGTAGSDGQDVESGMIVGSDGNLYGVTYRGGTGTIGVIFKLSTSGTYTIVAQVPQPGTPPITSLVQGTDGNFYGIFAGGGTGGGAIYSVTTSGTITGLHNFCQQSGCTDGADALTPLVQDTDGKFYSVTQNGGPSGCNSGIGCGVFYSFDVGLGAFINLVTTSGGESAKVQIEGQGLSSSSVVKFGGTQATSVTASGTTFLTATVPAGALTGPVTVTTGATTLTSPQTFKVKPGVKSFSPTSGPVGTAVTITGTELTQATRVTFNGTSATFTVNSDSQITATVPTGATTGKIAVTTKGGSASSTTSFTVN